MHVIEIFFGGTGFLVGVGVAVAVGAGVGSTTTSWLNLALIIGAENSKFAALRNTQPFFSPKTVVAI